MSEFAPQLIPKTWYVYDFPLTATKPHPSTATYGGSRTDALIKSAATMLSIDPERVTLRYDNNKPDRSDQIDVTYGGNPKACSVKPKHPELPGTNPMAKYNKRAKRSKTLKKFQDNSPANIEYFQPFNPCDAF